MSSPVSRGFRHLRRPADPSAAEEGRVPPGRYVTQGFPVLSAGPTPHTPLPDWTFSIRQGGARLAGAPGRPASGRPADRRGRLHRGTVLLHRRSWRRAGRDHGGTAR
jgi:hypothetical protein